MKILYNRKDTAKNITPFLPRKIRAHIRDKRLQKHFGGAYILSSFMQNIAKYFSTRFDTSVALCSAIVVAVFKYEQDKKREHSAQGAYIDVRDQAETERDEVLRSISKRH